MKSSAVKREPIYDIEEVAHMLNIAVSTVHKRMAAKNISGMAFEDNSYIPIRIWNKAYRKKLYLTKAEIEELR